jgi:hypothetical protein
MKFEPAMFTRSAADLRSYLQTCEKALQTHRSLDFAADVTTRIAFEIDDPTLQALALALNEAGPPIPHETIRPDGRDDAFDEQLDTFIRLAYKLLAEREEHEARVAANAQLSRAACRNRVLAYLASDRDAHWAQDVGRDLGLSYEQTLDALEQLDHDGALDGQRSDALNGSVAWFVRLNVHGRNLADGTTQRAGAAVVLQQSFHNSNIANAGLAHGSVTQNITINPEIAEIINALQQLQAAAESSPRTAAVAVLASEAQEEFRSNGWTEKAGGILTGIAGLVQTAASLKPAYDLLQPIAAAHGISVPVWQ